jgi:hypothetical protein
VLNALHVFVLGRNRLTLRRVIERLNTLPDE